jgi:hypothetical protein
MGRHSRCWIDKVLPSSDTDTSSDSSEDESTLDLQRYIMADIAGGLQNRYDLSAVVQPCVQNHQPVLACILRRDFRLSALHELKAILERAYKDFAPKVSLLLGTLSVHGSLAARNPHLVHAFLPTQRVQQAIYDDVLAAAQVQDR